MIVGVCSAKGGVGKTTFSVNLSIALSMYGVDVLLVDGDLTTGNVWCVLGQPFPDRNIQEYFRKGKSIDRLIFPHPSGIKVLASSIGMDSIDDYPLKTGLRRALKSRKEFVIVDMPATLGKETQYWLQMVDSIFVVATPDLNSLVLAVKLLKVASAAKKHVDMMVLNRSVSPNREMAEIRKIFNNAVPPVCFFSRDENVVESHSVAKPVICYAPYSRYSIEMLRLASKLTKKEMPAINPLLRIFGSIIKA